MSGAQARRTVRLARLAPFVGPLTDRSAGQTQKIVTSLFDWLRDVGYLQLNPATGLPTVGRREPEKQARFLSPDDTALLHEAIAGRPGAESGREARLAQARDLFLVDLFERTGLRTSQAVHCRIGHVRIEPVPQVLRREFPDAPPFQWLLRVERGKGGKTRWVPCDEIALPLADLPDRVWPATGAAASREPAAAAVGATLPLG
ncbi:hypothetical protein [Paraburkholderia sediminicola]|uniref:hypothetical protein n=1 Tax=Paraburkholderia sediminicola TaxID=458836 RepID=UPI0038BDAA1A